MLKPSIAMLYMSFSVVSVTDTPSETKMVLVEKDDCGDGSDKSTEGDSADDANVKSITAASGKLKTRFITQRLLILYTSLPRQISFCYLPINYCIYA